MLTIPPGIIASMTQVRKARLRDFIKLSQVIQLVNTTTLPLSKLLLAVIEHLTMPRHYIKFVQYIAHLFIVVIHSINIL